VKGSIITTKTWFLLIGAALLISAGVLNFRQRARNETPPWDGVEWTDTKEGVVAKSIERGSAADRAWLLPGDRLIGISLDPNSRPEQVAAARDVQIYLEQARVGGQLHYLMTRPAYSPQVGAYWADLDHLGAIHRWTPRVLYINLIGLIYLFVGFFVLFKQGGRAPFALHFATFSLAAFVFLFYTPVGSYRDLDLGYKLKLAQRERALAMRVPEITWTYDPLQAVNAHFNFAKLGVVVEEYEENVYGESPSPLHGGLPTDRFVCQWWIRRPHVVRRLDSSGLTIVSSEAARAPIVNRTAASGDWITPAGFDPDVRSPRVAVDIPADYTRMLSEDPSLALGWRLETRAIFAKYLDAGYRVVDFTQDEARTRGRYLLTTIRPDP